MTRALLLLLLASAVAMPSRAAAQSPSSPSSEALAKEHYERGAKLFADKNYIAALGEFAAGYDLVRKPMFLFNMGECARLAGERDEAKGYYQRYLAGDPKGKFAQLAQQRIDLLAEQAGAPPATPAPTATPPAPVAPNATIPQPTPATPHESSPPTRPPWMPPTPSLIAGGAGVVLLGLAGIFSIRATGKWSDAEDHCDAMRVCDHEGVVLAGQARTAADGATVTLVFGLAAIAGGGAYWFYDRYRARRAEERTRVVPTGTGVAIAGSF